VYDHAGRTFTLLGDSDRARCHSTFHPPAMRDLRINGNNSLLGVFTIWLKKQMGVRHERAGQVLAGLRARSTKDLSACDAQAER